MVTRVTAVGAIAITWGMTFFGGSASATLREFGYLAATVLLLLFVVSVYAGEACSKCSQCKIPLQSVKGQYCPGCGHRTLVNGNSAHLHHCSRCGLQLYSGKGSRKFEVLYCTECGSYVELTNL
jgi:DNA-directed RNA polymerase subunit RPC12/RpoP